MRQICNLAYAILLENRTAPQIAELELLLTEPDKKVELMEKQNQESMKALARSLPAGVGLLMPPGGLPRRPKPPEQKDES